MYSSKQGISRILLLPVRRFEPLFAGDDVQPPVLIFIGDRCRFVRARIDQLLSKPRLVQLSRPVRSGQEGGDAVNNGDSHVHSLDQSGCQMDD